MDGLRLGSSVLHRKRTGAILKPGFEIGLRRDNKNFVVGEEVSLGLVAVLVLGVVFTDTYNKGILQVWHLLMDIHLNLLHVRLEVRLSTPVLKNRATCHHLWCKTAKIDPNSESFSISKNFFLKLSYSKLFL
jgi:hypothetical protein